MAINLMADLGFDAESPEVKSAKATIEMYTDVIDELVSCRKSAGLTQPQVAKRMGTSQSAVSEFENVNSDARFSTLIRYARAVGCDMVIEITEPTPQGGGLSSSGWVEVKTFPAVIDFAAAPAQIRKYEEMAKRAPRYSRMYAETQTA